MGSNIQVQASDGHTLDAYVAQPQGAPRGAVVVVQEIFGVNSHIRSVADGYAAEGYLAIAPAMFDRQQRSYESAYSQPEVAAGVEVMKKLDWEQAMLDVQAALRHAKSSGNVGIVGYCWGGTVAWLAAARIPDLACAVAYYGGAVPTFIAENPRCPVMLHFGNSDQSIPVEKAREVAAAHPEALAHFYDAGHGFNCDQRGSYHAPSARLARERTLDFFREHIG